MNLVQSIVIHSSREEQVLLGDGRLSELENFLQPVVLGVILRYAVNRHAFEVLELVMAVD